MPDEEEFSEFLSRAEDVDRTIKGLLAGTVSVEEVDKKIGKIDTQKDAQDQKRAQEKERKRLEAEEAGRARVAKEKAKEEFKEANREALEKAKQEYYMRKAQHERWVEFRESNRSRAFSDYYKGWDLFEEDPDEDLFSGDSPAAVQDQAQFDAMAKDVEERSQKRKDSKAAAAKEKERGNVAFKAGQHSEAIASYSRAVEFFKGDKAVYANRALAHLRQHNYISALEDCNRAVEISRFLDDDIDRRPPPPPLLKAYVRRSAAHSGLGHMEEAAADLATAAEMAPEAELGEIRKLQKALKEDAAAAKREEEAAAAAVDVPAGGGKAATAQAMRTRVRELVEQLPLPPTAAGAPAAAADQQRPRLEATATELNELLRASVACRVALRQTGGVRQLMQLLPTSEPADATAAARLLCLAALERRNQLEVHACGGTTLLLRELRKAVPTTAEKDGAERGAIVDGVLATAEKLGPLSAQLRLLSLSCQHEQVVSEVKRLAAGENAHERLVTLLQIARAPSPGAKGASAARSPANTLEAVAAALSVLAVLSAGKGGKDALLQQRAPLVAALVEHVTSAEIAISEQAATALGNMSVHPKLRAEMVSQRAVEVRAPGVPPGSPHICT